MHGERPRPLHGGARFSESQQRLHGGTFVVDALFSGTTLDNGPNYLIDICLAEELVRRATAPLQQTHLDGDSTVLLKAAGVANATASGLAKALWTSIAQGLPPTHGLRGLKLVVAEHDASIAEYNGRLGHAPTLPTPMRRALERRLMEKELPWCESGWPLIAEDDPLIVPMMTGYSTGANLELDPLAPVLPVGTTIRTSVTRSFSLFNDNGAERMWALARGGAAGRTRGAPGPRCCARPSDGHAACRGGLERHHHDDAARPRQPAAVPSLCRESTRLQRALTHKPRLHVGGSCRRAVYHVEVNPMLRRWKRG